MAATDEIVQNLSNFQHGLRDDGITYLQYVTELTYLLFLKLMQETEQEKQLPEGYRWGDLVSKDELEQLTFYRVALLHLSSPETAPQVQAIFANAHTEIRKPSILKELVQSIDELDWHSAKEDLLGDLYEALLEKVVTSESKSGVGQHFTPRPLIDCIVALIQPQSGELVQDPAAGTGGFLVAASEYIKKHTDNLLVLSKTEQVFQRYSAFCGVELVHDVYRLLRMNIMLHGIEGTVTLGDTLSADGQRLAKADVILTNPPFGTRKGGLPSRYDFTYPTSNKQLAFLQHIYRSLKSGGRAAVVLPDNVLFENGQGRSIRADLMDKCNLHTILRLPTGIFYAQGVRTNVLFFQRGTTEKGNTQQVWIYDMRTNMPAFGKRTPLTREHFLPFEQCYGSDPNGYSRRLDQGEEGRFRCFSREEIAERGENLDICWLRKVMPPPTSLPPDSHISIPTHLTFIKHQAQNHYYEEFLAEDVLPLRMMLIPSGTFLMGSPETELDRSDAEGPQHEVTLSQFFMSKYPITQSQWRFVAELPEVNQKLKLAPSSFKGKKRPVDRVSWHDAIEFCERLSAHTGREYRLPTEAEWEYACRAGTTTPFHFGETITTDLANYCGVDREIKSPSYKGAYGRGPLGEYRQETTPIDYFSSVDNISNFDKVVSVDNFCVANAFGLCDMHGNVLEWCHDHWHKNYKDAPTDGSAWLTESESSRRTIRGGSWDFDPRFCRSAYRDYVLPDNRLNFIGFRVCCSSPRAL